MINFEAVKKFMKWVVFSQAAQSSLVLPRHATQAHSSKNLGSNVVARVTRLLTQRIMMGINLKTDISDMLLVSDSVIQFWHFACAEDKYANSLSRTLQCTVFVFNVWKT